MDLRFVGYIDGSTQVSLSPDKPETVTVVDNWWWYKRNTEYQMGPFQIGAGIRVPDCGENHEHYGPMMVINWDNPKHRAAYERARKELGTGTLVA